MKFNIQKYYYKLFDNKKYQKLKELNSIQESVKIFENKPNSFSIQHTMDPKSLHN